MQPYQACPLISDAKVILAILADKHDRDLWDPLKPGLDCHPKTYEAHTVWAFSAIGIVIDLALSTYSETALLRFLIDSLGMNSESHLGHSL